MVPTILKLKRKYAEKFRISNARRIADKKVEFLTKGMSEIEPEYAKEVEEYWSKYGEKVNTKWFDFYYCMNGTKDVRYIPDEIFYQKIFYKYANTEFCTAYEDKSYYDIFFSNLIRPQTCFKSVNGILMDEGFHIITENEAMNIAKNLPAVIIKPTIDSGEGINVSLIKNDDMFEINLKKAVEKLDHDYIVQEVIKQHAELSQIHSASVNTIRILSFLYHNEVIILSAVLRMGVNGSIIDNQCAGGCTCGINPNGQLRNKIYDGTGKLLERHPQGFIPDGFVIPSYDKVIATIKEAHLKLAHFGFVGWDFTIDEQGNPVYIEHNLSTPGVDLMQWCNGPLFGTLTDEILDDVYGVK